MTWRLAGRWPICLIISCVFLVSGCSAGGSSETPPPESSTGCNCGAVDERQACTGTSIAVTIGATRPSTSTATYRDAEFRWEFNSGGAPAYCGQFANGDYWIAPRKGASVQITSVTANGRVTMDDDPVMEELGLLDGSKHYGNHAPGNNVLRALPVSYSEPTSLVAAKQRDEAADGGCGTPGIVGECVDAYHVVTVLKTVPANAGSDMIRPNITGKTKRFLTLADFDFSRLPNSPLLNGTDAPGMEKIRQRWSHSTEAFGFRTYINGVGTDYSEGNRAFRAHILHHDYGSGMAQSFNNDLMTIFSDDNTLDQKRGALAAMLSYGLDIYQSRYDAPDGRIRGWNSGAGQSNGKILPAAFLAALMKDPAYANVLRTVGPNTHAANEADRGPPEMRQIHSGVNGVLIWGDEPLLTGPFFEGAYWGSMLKSQCFDGATGTWPGHETCNANYGEKTQVDPYGYIDGPPNLPGFGYMMITAGVQRAVVATMFLMPEVCDIVNYPELVAYTDRLSAVGRQTAPDQCAAPDPREDPATCDAYRNHQNHTCVYYGVTWGPDPNQPGQCIKDGKGRFTSRHGQPLQPVYTSAQVESNWAALRGSSSDCRR